MFMGILPRPALPGYGRSLANVPLSSILGPAGQTTADHLCVDGCVGDLCVDDHLVVQSCSKSLFASHHGVRCRLSYWLREPRAIQSRFYRMMRLISRRYDRVLTYDDDLCRTIPNAAFLAHGGCWVRQPSLAGNVTKTQWMSVVASPKRSTVGHRMRHEVIEWAAENLSEGNTPQLTAFGHQYNSLDDKQDSHQPYQFSVVIENSRTSNYFTEKLIDCLVCNSLPIYWGAPEITEYFDPRGMLVCETFDDVVAAIRSCDGDLYRSRLPYLNANRLRALRYADPHRLVFDSLRGHCDVPTTTLSRIDRPQSASVRPDVNKSAAQEQLG